MQYSRIQGYDQGMLYFLNEASDVLFASLTLEDELIFDRISGLIVPHLADWFAIDVLDAVQGLKLLTLAHKDKEKLKWGYELRKSYPTDLNGDTGVAGVLRSGKPEMYQEITDEMLQKSAKDAKHLEIMRSIGFKSVIIAPLKSRNLTFGTITFVATKDSDRIYTADDLTLIENFANKVAIAIDNSRLYKVAQQEITKSKLIEEEVIRLLEESKINQEWLDSLLRTTPGIVWETKLNHEDGSQQMTFVSKYAEQMLGYNREEMFSVNFWRSIIHPDDTPKIVPNRQESYQQGTSQHQYRLIRKDGVVIWAEARAQVLYDETGRPRGMRGITFDITRMKELEMRKDKFISIASHELKTPITSAKLIVQILTEYAAELSEETRYFTKKLDRQLDSLTFLIDSMLDVNKLASPGAEFKNEPFDLNLLIEEVVGSQRELNPNEFSIEGAVQHRVNCDRDRIKQVLVILLNNAVKYSDKGLPVKISVQRIANSVQVSVQDKGVGIESEYHQKIFEKFFRVADQSIRYISGMGIGLTIAQQIIEGYGGKIWVESTPGKGSTFHFSLPPTLIAD